MCARAVRVGVKGIMPTDTAQTHTRKCNPPNSDVRAGEQVARISGGDFVLRWRAKELADKHESGQRS